MTARPTPNGVKRPLQSTHSVLSPTVENPIKAPPRAAIARERSADREDYRVDSNDQSEAAARDDGDAEQNAGEPDDDKAAEGRRARDDGDQARRTSSSAKWGSRAVNIASPRRARAAAAKDGPENKSRGPIEGKVSGVAALAKLTGHSKGVKKAGPSQDDEDMSPPSPPDQTLQAALDQQQKLQAELEQYKERAQHHDSELTALRLAKEQEEECSQQRARTVAAQEARLAAEARDKTFWARKHEEVHRQYLKTESEYRILQATVADRDGMWKREWERKNEHLLQERDRCRDGFHAAQRAAQEWEDEAREMRRQVLELKHSISTSTRTEAQVTDDVFREKVRLLGHDVQNWTITNYRKRELDISELSEKAQEELSSTVPFYDRLLPSSKLDVIQSIVAGMLVEDVFRPYFFGLPPDRVSQCRKMEEYLLTIGSAATVNQWRSLTLTIVRHSASDALRALTHTLIEAVQARVDSLLCELTGTAPSEARARGLRAIVEQAVQLARLFRVQRAQFAVDAPGLDAGRPGACAFDGASMEDVGGDADDDNDDDDDAFGDEGGRDGEGRARARWVRCVTFPAVCKAGDEAGDNGQLHLRNVIVKAKVLCHAAE
ncbi:MAG: hypothetical protein M1832_003021 [Thelocarpon impressellum]|nr:MAG: hypothetical protein M1832_003021 [Thelocarpon impressellum]